MRPTIFSERSALFQFLQVNPAGEVASGGIDCVSKRLRKNYMGTPEFHWSACLG
jgi:hypothetical protein